MKEVPFDDKTSMNKALQEKHTMMKVYHRNIVKYVDSFIAGSAGNKLYLIMEYCDKGDLQDYLKRIGITAGLPNNQKSKNGGVYHSNGAKSNMSQMHSTQVNFTSTGNLMDLGEIRIWKFFIQICLALEVIHDKGIVHADLKPSNVLMTG